MVEGTESDGPKGAPPKAGGVIGECPKSESAAVRRKWRVLLREVGWLSQSSDRASLLDLCRAIVEADDAYVAMRKESRYVVDKAGNVKEHPAARRWERLSGEAWKRMRTFGMTPADSVRLMVGERAGGASQPEGSGAFIR